MTAMEMSEAERRRHRAIIAAAVAAIFGDRVRIREIEHVNDPVRPGWVETGRHAVHLHNLTSGERKMPETRTDLR